MDDLNMKRTIYNFTLKVYKAVVVGFMDLLKQIVKILKKNNVGGKKRDLYLVKFDTIRNELFEFVRTHLVTLSVEKVATRVNGELFSVLQFGGLNSASDFLTYGKYYAYVNNTLDFNEGAELTVLTNFCFLEANPSWFRLL